MTERESLARIRSFYGEFLAKAAKLHRHRPEVLAGIMQRETEGGLSRYLSEKGAAGMGDGGNGMGLMQIDRRSFPEFYKSGGWKSPDQNIHFAAFVLADKRAYVVSHTLTMGLSDAEIERAAIASYNCGQGNVMKALRNGDDVDSFTAHKNYSAEVLRLAEIYRGIANLPDVA